MHFFFATLFSLVFSFSHAASVRQSASTSFVEPVRAGYSMEYTPSHRELVRATFTTARYAEAACVSCRRISATYRVR